MNYPVLIAGTVLIVIFSWHYSVKQGRYHGVARFFSFESIFILLMLNLRYWFSNPFSFLQILSWIFLFASIYPGLAGFITLHTRGKPENNHIERTTVLVKTGIYKYIRHPLYCSLLLLGTGTMLKHTGTLQLILGTVNILAIYLTARIEEGEMKKKFGPDYTEYMSGTKMFIPFLF